jgi:hypothetical protein
MIVEVAVGGVDFAGCDMLAMDKEYARLGEGHEYDDPREVVKAAIAISKFWTEKRGKIRPISCGSTMGVFELALEEEVETMEELVENHKEAEEWCEKVYEQLPKCGECGSILSTSHLIFTDNPVTLWWFQVA